MHGWTGKILHIDLSSREFSIEYPAEDVYRAWLGGRGLAGCYLFPHAQRAWDDPATPVLLMTGPLAGTSSPMGNASCVMTRSPLTGTVGDTAIGGHFGEQLKRAGWDGIVITGQASSPCGVEIQDHRVVFSDAGDLRDLTSDTRYAQLSHKGSVVFIGPAAEHGVRFASLLVDGAFATGRNGLGLSFAAKKLWYVAVTGSGNIPVADPGGLAKASEDILRQIAASPFLFGEQGLLHYGTAALYDLVDSRRMMPTANFRRTHFPPARHMNAPAMKQRYATEGAGCEGCPIQCKRLGRQGEHIPDFESLSHFSALIENADLDIALKANTLCDLMGMDPVSAAATLACYQEISGAPISGEHILTLLEAIGRGQGLGAALGQGSRRYAEAAGHADRTMAVKGQELPPYDPRGAYGMALAYVTSTCGGCHLRAYPASHEILRKPVATDRFSFEGKARMNKIAEDANAAVDSLVACKFAFMASSLEEYAKVYSAVTGISATGQDLLRIGERIDYRERVMNAANGFASEADDLPNRFFVEPGTGGNALEIPPLDREAFLAARAKYYRVRGLDSTGRPVRERADELGLTWIEPAEVLHAGAG